MVVTGLILRGSWMPPDEIPKILFRFSDKVIHGSEFLILFLVTLNAFSRTFQNVISRHLFWGAVFYSFAISTFTEWGQQFVSGRACDVWDWVANACGILIGGILMQMIPLIFQSRIEAS